MKQAEDLTGKKFGRWTVLYKVDHDRSKIKYRKTVWHCVCECGTEGDVSAGSLKCGSSLSCGCYKMDKITKDVNLIGKRFGRWLVLSKGSDFYSNMGRRYTTWKCKCDCGTIKDVTQYSLTRGKSTSCGCLRRESCQKSAVYLDLTGNRYGHWTVLRRMDDRFYDCGGRSQMWECKCDCGQIKIIDRNMLKLGISQSCGCQNSSVMETHVKTYLDSHGFDYIAQMRYDDLLGDKNGSLSYDFLVFKNDTPFLLVECQGEQHYRPVKYFGGLSKFKTQQEHDKLKRDYAKSIGISLLEIKYTKRTYEMISDILNKYLL